MHKRSPVISECGIPMYQNWFKTWPKKYSGKGEKESCLKSEIMSLSSCLYLIWGWLLSFRCSMIVVILYYIYFFHCHVCFREISEPKSFLKRNKTWLQNQTSHSTFFAAATTDQNIVRNTHSVHHKKNWMRGSTFGNRQIARNRNRPVSQLLHVLKKLEILNQVVSSLWERQLVI